LRVPDEIWDRGVALISRLQSFETEILAEDAIFAGLAAPGRALIAKAETLDSGYRTVLDMDSSEFPVCGAQEKCAYNECRRKVRGSGNWQYTVVAGKAKWIVRQMFLMAQHKE
jgi:hypothetical protein